LGSGAWSLPNVPGADVWSQVPGAGNAVETMLPVFATHAVHEHGMSLSRVADLLATTPAKTFGLYPRKGAIRVGADADLAIVEADGAKRLDGAQLEYHDQEPWSPFDGLTLRVYPVYTVLRGKVIFAEGAVQGRPGDGRHLRAAEPALA
jgi:dihydroorotase-like cyclic amidohydrolase